MSRRLRLLHVIHDFLPERTGGSEVYCDHLCRELSRHHDVALLFTEYDPASPQYSVRRGRHHGVPFHAVVHNHVYDSFEASYVDTRMDAIFASVLDDVRPDVVHLHHLLFHSINYVAIAKQRTLPVVMTLHDYWLSCPNMGQRLRRDGTLCDVVEPKHCARCIARFSPVTRAAKRAVQAIDGRRQRSERERALRGFTFRGHAGASAVDHPAQPVDVGGVRRSALVFPEPGRLARRFAATDVSRVRFSVGAAEQSWNGDQLAVIANGREVAAHALATEGPVREGWVDFDVAVDRSESDQFTLEIEWRGASQVSEANHLACADIRLISKAEPRGSALMRLKTGYRTIESAIGALAPSRRHAVDQRLARMRETCNQIDLFVAPSKFIAQRMIEFGVDASRVVHSRNGIGVAGSPRPPRQPDAPLRVAYVGMLSPHKGVHVLIDAFSRVLAGRPAVAPQLSIHGNIVCFPDYVRDLRRRGKGLNVAFAGDFNHADAADIYSQVDVVVVPSVWWENAPMTAFEAWACGAAVIAADTGGLSELIEHDVNGLLVRPNDAAGLAAAMQRLLDEPALLERLQKAVPSVKTAAADAIEMADRYVTLRETTVTSSQLATSTC